MLKMAWWSKVKNISNTRYDTALLAESQELLQKLLGKTEVESERKKIQIVQVQILRNLNECMVMPKGNSPKGRLLVKFKEASVGPQLSFGF